MKQVRSARTRAAKAVIASATLLGVATLSFVATGQETTTTIAEPESTTTQPVDPTTTTETPATEPASTVPEPAAPTASSTTTGAAANSAEKAKAVANLNLAKAADIEIANQLNGINEAANSTLEKIDLAEAQIAAADKILDRTGSELSASEQRQNEIEADLSVKAVRGFKNGSLSTPHPVLSGIDMNRLIRQNALLSSASLSTAELIEDLRGLLEDRQIARAAASKAKAAAEESERVLQSELEVYKQEQAAQLEIKAEVERRVDKWAGELAAYAKADSAVQKVIVDATKKAPVKTVVNAPSKPSLSGFQWPVNAPVTSEYGYRIHPVYRTRRLHAGMDVGAAGGTPIASSNDGNVIFSGTQGGYGRTVIVDHGGGLTTLYAHMSVIRVSNGQTVSRGDILGDVGRSGTATGNHLHFEVRVNGSASNPRNYLP